MNGLKDLPWLLDSLLMIRVLVELLEIIWEIHLKRYLRSTMQFNTMGFNIQLSNSLILSTILMQADTL